MYSSYDTKAQSILDIIANTDAPYRVALLAAKYVFEENWSYDINPDKPRAVLVSPDFSAPNAVIIELAMIRPT